MNKFPVLKTRRLILRAFTLTDVPEVRRLAGDKSIASPTLAIPHPYEENMAAQWIMTHEEKFEAGEEVHFAITRRETHALMGAVSLMNINKTNETAELGYWIGKPYWNNGYCTEAGHAALAYAFDVMRLNRVYMFHFTRNPASGNVMRKLGMTHEGTLRQHIKKWNQYEDEEFYGILRQEYQTVI